MEGRVLAKKNQRSRSAPDTVPGKACHRVWRGCARRRFERLTPLFEARAVCTKVCPYGSVRGCVKNAFLGARCCIRDEGRSFGAGLQEQASNSRKLLSSNGGGAERYGNGVE